MSGNRVQLTLESLSDRVVPAGLGGGHAAVDLIAATATAPAKLDLPNDTQIEMPDAAATGLKTAADAPSN